MDKLFPTTRRILETRQYIVDNLWDFFEDECGPGMIFLPLTDIKIGWNYFGGGDESKLKCIYINPKKSGLGSIEFRSDDGKVYQYVDMDILYLSEIVGQLMAGNFTYVNIKASLMNSLNRVVEDICDLPDLTRDDDLADLYVVQHYLAGFIYKFERDLMGSPKYVTKCLKSFYASMTDFISPMDHISKDTQDKYCKILQRLKDAIQTYENYTGIL